MCLLLLFSGLVGPRWVRRVAAARTEPRRPWRVGAGRGWLAHFAAIDGPRLFVLEGLTMYLDEPAVRDLVTELADRCPGSHLLIETAGPLTQPPAATGSSTAPGRPSPGSAGARAACPS